MATLLFNYADYSLEIKGPINKPDRTRILPVTARRTMSGSLYSYIKTPGFEESVEDRFSIRLRIWDQIKMNEILNFFNLAQGNEIDYTDEMGSIWDGRILDHSIKLIEGNKRRWDVEIIFQGSSSRQLGDLGDPIGV